MAKAKADILTKIEKVNKTEEKLCKVIYKDSFVVGFNFDGYGISVPYKKEIDKAEVLVSYTGEIGKKDFTIVEIK